GMRVAGAGAALWRVDPVMGSTVLEAEAIMAIPAGATPQAAEAWGAHLAILLLCRSRGNPRATCVSGDNLAVLRYCASQGRLRHPEVHNILDSSLARVAACGWAVRWQAVRRHANAHADGLATEVVFFRVARLARSGAAQPQFRVRGPSA
ncbi:MAG: hypothetical protein ACKPKO_32520, partial [Candidatus Fonsibacter sp.]